MQPRLNFFQAAPSVMEAMGSLEKQIAQSCLERPLLELVRIRASQLNGCAFCVDRHVADARKAGECERKLATLTVWRESPFFSERERAALEWTEAVTLIAVNRVPDDVWAQVSPAFTAAEIVELTFVINTINAWNRLAVAFRKVPA